MRLAAAVVDPWRSSHALRQELADVPGVHVCTVCPSSIETPFWQRSANYRGRKSKPVNPVYSVEQVAGIVVGLTQAPQREVFAVASGWVLSEQHAAAPELTEGVVENLVARDLLQDAPAEPNHGSNFKPAPSNGSGTGSRPLTGSKQGLTNDQRHQYSDRRHRDCARGPCHPRRLCTRLLQPPFQPPSVDSCRGLGFSAPQSA